MRVAEFTPTDNCSMSSYMDGPWSCGSHRCDKGERCKATQTNANEQRWLELHEWENAWLAACGMPALTIRDARDALSWKIPYERLVPVPGDR